MAGQHGPRSGSGKCPKCKKQFTDLLEHVHKHQGHVFLASDFEATDLTACTCDVVLSKKGLNRHYARNPKCNAKGLDNSEEEDEIESPEEVERDDDPIVVSDSGAIRIASSTRSPGSTTCAA
jgi:hypothetical protein